ncbi:hypothetical protein JW977_04210 [Candidatus Falkowbacteria bacterium]|nr:hypothetical protein [Candidatus Falkowbacteria bacterium]
MAILVKCDCGYSFFAGPGTMRVKQTKRGPEVACICPHCKQMHIAYGDKVKNKENPKKEEK